MDYYNNIINIINSGATNIKETFKQQKMKIKKNIGNLNTHTFYGVIIVIIILSIILPIVILYVYNPGNLKKILFDDYEINKKEVSE